ncbi:uncharacterized protein LOC124154354 isoform X4 [Ischnura elegans]|uniref:uncharacterized protein LOC124154354 isoform X4 n=1 Tax=Ischnura elegans TaxID=197161 RepID=UPI001ED88B46|nr:uncharacterized protein LOC124154354 isoform X4 [Ischnura elegans]
MTKTSLLTILGACTMFAAVVISNPVPELEVSEEFLECKRATNEKGEAIYECILQDYTEDQMNETLSMFPDTNCPKCRHLCRKQAVLTHCLRNGAESLRTVSNKSLEMVPFIAEMMEAALVTLCENDGDMANVLEDEEDSECFRKVWSKCSRPRLSFMENLERVAFCDAGDEETDPFTKGYVCQKVVEFFECSEAEAETCSPTMKTNVSKMKSQISSLDSCAKYF